MAAVRIARTRVTGRAGVYRGATYTRRVHFLPIEAPAASAVSPGAGVITVSGNRAAQMPLMPAAGTVTISGGAVAYSLGGGVADVEQSGVLRLFRTRIAGRPGGVYRTSSISRRTVIIPLGKAPLSITPAAAVITVEGQPVARAPTPISAGVVLVEGISPNINTGGQMTRSAFVGEVLVNGNAVSIILPARVQAILQALTRAARKRRHYLAAYATSYPLPDWNVTMYQVMRILPGRIVQAPEGTVTVEGQRPSLQVDGVALAGSDAGIVLVESTAPFTFWVYVVDAGAGEVEVVGEEPFTTALEAYANAVDGEVEVLGYNPTVTVREFKWTPSSATSTDWTAQEQTDASWSDVATTTSTWTRVTQ